jgi:hypothetical protein
LFKWLLDIHFLLEMNYANHSRKFTMHYEIYSKRMKWKNERQHFWDRLLLDKSNSIELLKGKIENLSKKFLY